MASELLLGTRKGLLRYGKVHGAWKLASHCLPGLAIPYAVRDPRTGTLWCGVDTGHWGQKLMRSRDGGATWEDAGQPVYPEGAELKPGVPATLRYLWVLQPSVDAEPGVHYIGTEPGGLFRSEDDGDTWSLLEGLWNHPSRQGAWFGGGRDEPGIHSVIVDPRDPRHLYVGISCAGVFESRDRGATWHPRNQGLTADFLPNPTAEVGHDPHYLAACPANPDELWQQNHCGIFRSADGAASWQAVSVAGRVAHFGFAVAVDAADPGTAWVVPATSDGNRMAVNSALCVCRTDDGGRTWNELRDGLPQEGAYDITFRHALDVRGNTVAFGTTTGNVYVSADRGESWTCLGNNLPPVYSVRFAE